MTVEIKRESIPDQIAFLYTKLILGGEILPGEQLPTERDLADKFSVTRSSIKQMLLRLEERGLIETKYGVGSIVKDYTKEAGLHLLPWLSVDERFLRDIFEVRREVGSVIAGLAAKKRRSNNLSELQQIVSKMKSESNLKLFQDHDIDFHKSLAKATQNEAFTLLVNTMLNSYNGFKEMVTSAFEKSSELALKVEEIYFAVKDGDSEVASERAKQYYKLSGERIIKAIKEKTQ